MNSSRPLLGGLLLLSLLGLLAGLGPTHAHAQSTAAPKPAASAATPAGPGANGTASKVPASTRPLWTELTADQQKSLAPLATHWNALHPAQKRKWIALSQNFDGMSASEQQTLHSRMTEWASLSAQDRTRARLNFAEVKRLAPEEERKAKWEAYQALSDEEKRKLAERAGTRPPSAAAPVRPVPAQKLAPVPSVAASNQYPPRIQLAPPPSSPAVAATPAPVAAPAISPAVSVAPAATVAPAPLATPQPAPAAPAPAAIRPQEAP